MYRILTKYLRPFFVEAWISNPTSQFHNQYHIDSILIMLSSIICKYLWHNFFFLLAFPAWRPYIKRSFLRAQRTCKSLRSTLGKTCSFFYWWAFSNKTLGYPRLLMLPNIWSSQKCGFSSNNTFIWLNLFCW